jgi:sialic acid synthase SpsE
MKTGEKISLDDVIMKRPWHGISPIYIKKIVWETLLKDISEDSLLTDKHLKL